MSFFYPLVISSLHKIHFPLPPLPPEQLKSKEIK